ncbi:MAG: hypothetical protein A2Y63_01255 [Candidatus Riflebacteria bacterium RBG_13_59_9]|nr:MAG: hypothetical protein A2Y63_01255 [Candidatus Riflebacteria bacterium RBG_13_59_9]
MNRSLKSAAFAILVVTAAAMLTACSAMGAWDIIAGQFGTNPPVELTLYAAEGQPQVSLYWAGPSSLKTGYEIHRATSPGAAGSGDPLATLAGSLGENTFVDDTALSGTRYYYVVRAISAGEVTDESNEASAMPRALTAVVDPAFLFVDPAAIPGGDGSSQNPFDTIAAAVAAVASGGTVLLLDGTYNLASAILLGNPVEIRSVTGSYRYSNAILDGGGNAISAIECNAGSDGSTIRGLELTDFARNSDQSSGIIKVGGASNPADISILDNHLHDNIGVSISNFSDTVISTGTRIAGNRIENQTVKGAGISVRRLQDGFIEDNILDTMISAGIQVDNSTGFSVARNQVRNTQGHGINLGPNGAFTVTDNIVENCNLAHGANSGGIRFYGAQITGTVTISGNTVSNCFNNISQRDDAGTIFAGISVHNNSILAPVAGSMLIYNGVALGTLDARFNWFGSAGGPDPSLISPNVDYSSWLTSAP